jgi:hypothetical protein
MAPSEIPHDEPPSGERPRDSVDQLRQFFLTVLRDPRRTVASGVILAVAGFLLIAEYRPRLGFFYNVMTGETLGTIPYRYVLLCSLALIAWGLFRHWTPEKK